MKIESMMVNSRDGTTIACDVLGEGESLIVITGATCFRKFMPVLADAKTFAKHFRVYSYDRRGRGDSGDNAPYTLVKEVDDVEAIARIAPGKVTVYGHSSGAVIALEAALRFPEKISKVVIYDPAYASSDKESDEWIRLIPQMQKLVSEKKDKEALAFFYKIIEMPSFFFYLLRLMPGWKTLKALYPTLLYDMDITKYKPDGKHLSAIKVPLIVMHGEKSPPSMGEVSRMIVESVKGSQLVEVKGQDHMISAKLLIPFLKEKV